MKKTTTRIYQAKINTETSCFLTEVPDGLSISQALGNTHELFQDAVNYHLVALAGMVNAEEARKDTIAGRFRQRVESIWDAHPKGNPRAQTLRQSIAKSLNLKNPSFEQAVKDIFNGCEHPEVLSHVLDCVLFLTKKGESVIQQQGRDLLPKLCKKGINPNYDFTNSSIRFAIRQEELCNLLHLDWNPETERQLCEFASIMSLGDVGIKLTSKACDKYAQEEFLHHSVDREIKEIQDALDTIFKIILTKKSDPLTLIAKEQFGEESYMENIEDLKEKCNEYLSRSFISKNLHKNNKPKSVKPLAMFFMYFPCEFSAKLLKSKLTVPKGDDHSSVKLTMQYDGHDPIKYAKGDRGYVYPAFSSLPNWEAYQSEWEILAFKEALKTLHSFELKTKERREQYEKEQDAISCILGSKEQKITGEDDEATALVILGGDPRFELAEEMLKYLALNTDDEFLSVDTCRPYTVSTRALKGWKDVLKAWNARLAVGDDSEVTRIKDVRNIQGEMQDRFGSAVLFESLAKDTYKSIWSTEAPDKSDIKRSDDIMYDICRLHEREDKASRLKEPVRITAAEAEYSPRLLSYSELAKGKREGAYSLGKKDELRLPLFGRNEKGHWQTYPACIRYSAPRADRDQLNMGDTSAAWIQQMIKPIVGTLDALVTLDKEAAFTLSVKKDPSQRVHSWLNFATTLDLSKLQEKIGAASLWDAQILGFNNKLLHLHWPNTYANKKINAWWTRLNLKNDGFSVLSVDLGLRYAAAWAYTEVGMHKSVQEKGRVIGKVGDEYWIGQPKKSGLIRLDGEGKTAHRVTTGVQAAAGIRLADEIEKKRALKIIVLEMKMQPYWNEESKLRILDLHRSLCESYRRFLSRYSTFLSWCYRFTLPEKREDTKLRVLKYLNYGAHSKNYIPGLIDALNAGDDARAIDLLMVATDTMRKKLPRISEEVMNTILPRKKDRWHWISESREGWIGCGAMQLMPVSMENKKSQKIWHHGGISMSRINLLEDLRRSIQSLNRLLCVTPGEQGMQGRSSFDSKVIDPCPALREKIDHMRENRINQLAGRIAAQALGVRLLPSRSGKNPIKDIIHGEYEKIPNRNPVDFVILENLDRYLTTVDRSRLENSSLMQWSHRKLVDKIKQILTDICGIPVVFASPVYTSKFDCMSSKPGFRAMPVSAREHANPPLTQSDDKKNRQYYERLLFRIKESGHSIDKLRLYVPQQGGEYFIAIDEKELVDTPRNADVNAAINVAWRGLASPESFDLLHRLRLEKKKNKPFALRKNNMREKAHANVKVHIVENEYKNGFASAFHCDNENVAELLTLELEGISRRFCHSSAVWGYVKGKQWDACHRLNKQNLEKAGLLSYAIEVEELWLSKDIL